MAGGWRRMKEVTFRVSSPGRSRLWLWLCLAPTLFNFLLFHLPILRLVLHLLHHHHHVTSH
jgi:hypothetical protein